MEGEENKVPPIPPKANRLQTRQCFGERRPPASKINSVRCSRRLRPLLSPPPPLNRSSQVSAGRVINRRPISFRRAALARSTSLKRLGLEKKEPAGVLLNKTRWFSLLLPPGALRRLLLSPPNLTSCLLHWTSVFILCTKHDGQQINLNLNQATSLIPL